MATWPFADGHRESQKTTGFAWFAAQVAAGARGTVGLESVYNRPCLFRRGKFARRVQSCFLRPAIVVK